MKRCPTCNRTYDDDALSFCPSDGSSLVRDEPAAPASFDPQATIMAPPPANTYTPESFGSQPQSPTDWGAQQSQQQAPTDWGSQPSGQPSPQSPLSSPPPAWGSGNLQQQQPPQQNWGGGYQQQPMMPGGPGGAPPVQNYLIPAILVTVFCCLPAGVVSIIYATQVNSKLAAGDIAGAEAASKNAKTWMFVSIGVGVVVTGLWILINILAAISR